MPDCRHLLCELIGDSCSLAIHRTRGCRPNITPREVAPAVFDEVRTLLAAIDPDAFDERARTAAIRLAAIVRREALDDRNLVAIAHDDEPELAPLLVRLCSRHTSDR